MDQADAGEADREVPSEEGSGGLDPADRGLIEEDDLASAEMAECLRLLDEVWPGEDPQLAGVPRELGRFRILGELGRGGFGVVFLAEDPLLRRRVALKVPRMEILAGSESWRRFLREIRAAARPKHPNLVPLLDAGAIGPIGYIVSAYIPGPSLEHWLRGRSNPVQPRWAARLVGAMARAVDHVHGLAILHRDLKPGNVLLDAEGRDVDPADPTSWADVPDDAWIPRICDFGLAKLYEMDEEETRSRVVCGSPPYMAPEQADSRREEIGPATDVYGLGAILYELLAGRPPFGGRSQIETLRRVVSEEPVPPRRRRPGVPRDLETICLKCLSKRPEDRYATAADLADDLERYLEGRPIAARRTPPWERAYRWAVRNPTAAVLATVVVLAIGSAFSGLLWHDAVLRLEADRAERHARDADIRRGEADRAAVELRRQLAGSQVFQAQQSAMSGDFESARRLVDAASREFGEADSTSFVRGYVRETIHDHISVLEGHGATVGCLAVSPDGRRLASGDSEGRIRIWDVDGDRSLREVSGGPSELEQLVWSPGSVLLASADRDSGLVRIWEAGSGRLRGHLEGTGTGEPVWSLAFSDGGNRITAMRARKDPSASPIETWDLGGAGDTFPVVVRLDDAIGDNPRLSSIARALDGEEPPADRPAVPEAGRGDDSIAVQYTRDRAMAVASLGGSTFEVYRARSRIRLASIRLGPDGPVVVAFGQFRSADAPSKDERRRLARLTTSLIPGSRGGRTPPGMILQAAGSAVCAFGPEPGQCVLWDEDHDDLSLISSRGDRRRAITELGPLAGVRAMTFDPGRRMLFLGSEDGRIRIWRMQPQRRVRSFDGHGRHEAWAVAFSPDGRTLATGGDDGRVRLWDTGTWRERAVIHEHASLITSLAFSPDGRSLAIGSFDGRRQTMKWDLASCSGAVLRGHRGRVRSVAFNFDGSILGSSGDDENVILWDSRDGRQKAAHRVGNPLGPGHLVFSPDGRTIAAGLGKQILFIDVTTGSHRFNPFDEPVSALVYTPDGSLLLLGMHDGSVRIWEVSSGRVVRTVHGHVGEVLGVAVTPDGTAVASAGQDKTVLVWDIATGQKVLSLADCRARVNSVAFSPDGKMLAAADHSGTITIWNARTNP